MAGLKATEKEGPFHFVQLRIKKPMTDKHLRVLAMHLGWTLVTRTIDPRSRLSSWVFTTDGRDVTIRYVISRHMLVDVLDVSGERILGELSRIKREIPAHLFSEDRI